MTLRSAAVVRIGGAQPHRSPRRHSVAQDPLPDRAVVAANPQKAMDEQSTPEEAAELACDEAGQADPVGARGSGGEEDIQVLPDDPVQDRIGGGARDVGSHGAGPSGFRAARQRLAAPRQNEVAPGTEAARCNTRRNPRSTAGHRSARRHRWERMRWAGSMMRSAGSSLSWGCGLRRVTTRPRASSTVAVIGEFQEAKAVLPHPWPNRTTPRLRAEFSGHDLRVRAPV